MDQDPKSVQKFTNSVQDVIAEMQSKHPKPGKDATQTEVENYKMLMINAVLDKSNASDWAKEDLRNQTWEDNHRTIMLIMNAEMQNNRQMPSVNQLLKKTGLSRQTILKHLKGFHKAAFYQDHLQQFRLMTGNVLTQVYSLAMQGDVKAAKVYLDAVGGMPDLKQPISEDRPANNYIQINNNIKIDQPTFTMLPEGVQRQIAELVLQGMQTTIAKSIEQPPTGENVTDVPL